MSDFRYTHRSSKLRIALYYPRDRSTELVPRTRTRWCFSTWALWPGNLHFRIDKRKKKKNKIVCSFRSMGRIGWGEAGYMWKSSWYFSRCRFMESKKWRKKWKKELIWEECSLVNLYLAMHVKISIRLYSLCPSGQRNCLQGSESNHSIIQLVHWLSMHLLCFLRIGI